MFDRLTASTEEFGSAIKKAKRRKAFKSGGRAEAIARREAVPRERRALLRELEKSLGSEDSEAISSVVGEINRLAGAIGPEAETTIAAIGGKRPGRENRTTLWDRPRRGVIPDPAVGPESMIAAARNAAQRARRPRPGGGQWARCAA